MPAVIKVEDLSKAYQLGEIGTGTISRDLQRTWARVRGKEDPFLKIGEVNDRSVKGTSDIVWSLKDLNFEIEQGDAVGIIGRNGAGKSTLLKILSRVTAPTKGSVKIKGRVASLLEVGTGFHPELTGRENIYLNGAILGMRKAEIKRQFDAIVDFSGVDRYIDTPVKRYSSGMYVRLAFGVAAHLQSEILIVDEVLAVGDAEFQKKCLGKMGDVSKSEGRTVLFVSHNMSSILQLCSTAILLKNGMVLAQGTTQQTVSGYISETLIGRTFQKDIGPEKKIQVTSAEIIDGSPADSILIKIVVYSTVSARCSIDLRVNDCYNNPFGFASLGGINASEMVNLTPGKNDFLTSLYVNDMALGIYTVNIDLTQPNIEYYDQNNECLRFEIIKNAGDLDKRYMSQEWNYGSYHIPFKLITSNV